MASWPWKRGDDGADPVESPSPSRDERLGLVDDPSAARARYAEALDQLNERYPDELDDPAPSAFARYQARLDLLASDERSDRLRAIIDQLGHPPFTVEEDFAPNLDQRISGVIDPRRHHRILHLRPRCAQRHERPKSRAVEGVAAEVLAEPRVRPCEACARSLYEAADWVRRRHRWVHTRDALLATVVELHDGQPAEVDTVWAMMATLGRWHGLKARVAVRSAAELSEISAERSAAAGARKAAEFDAALYLALHEAAENAEDATEQADLEVLRDVLGDGESVDGLVETSVHRRTKSVILRSSVRKRLDIALASALEQAVRIHGELHDRTGSDPSHLNGTVENNALARRVLVTHGARLREGGWVPSVGFARPPSEAVARMMEAAKDVNRRR